jgi:hypothetical protein
MLPFQALVNIFRNTAKEFCSVTAEYTATNNAAKLCPAPGSRRATSSSDREASCDVTI